MEAFLDPRIDRGFFRRVPIRAPGIARWHAPHAVPLLVRTIERPEIHTVFSNGRDPTRGGVARRDAPHAEPLLVRTIETTEITALFLERPRSGSRSGRGAAARQLPRKANRGPPDDAGCFGGTPIRRSVRSHARRPRTRGRYIRGRSRRLKSRRFFSAVRSNRGGAPRIRGGIDLGWPRGDHRPPPCGAARYACG